MSRIDENFIWKSCWADINKSAYSRILHYYLHDVIEPALASLEKKIKDYEERGGAWAAFGATDVQYVKQETMVALSLSVQSLWERQLRSYLHQCAAELYPDNQNIAKRANSSVWSEIEKLFAQLRGITLPSFKSFHILKTLHFLGNAARHGEGGSAETLRKTNPEFFEPLQSGQYHPIIHLGQFSVTPNQLRNFVTAIGLFWDEIELLRLRSLKSRDSSVTKQIDVIGQRLRTFDAVRPCNSG